MHTPQPYLISYNLTKRCNLKCKHCYLDAGELEGRFDMPTSEVLAVIDSIAEINPSAMLILTGGEPLLRGDIFQIVRHASDHGFTVFVGTNGTGLTGDTVERLKESGVKGVGISLDSVREEVHDEFRGLRGAWRETVQAMDLLREGGLPFQVQFSVTRENKGELKDMLRLSLEKGATALNIFFLVCTGRGEKSTDLSPDEYESVITEIAELSRDYEDRIMVRSRCAPHIFRVADRINPSLLKGLTSGCIAAKGYMRITPDGYVTPCPYIPEDGSRDMNIRHRDLKSIWYESPLFKSMREAELGGKCGSCEYNELCGGCRARALALKGDLMDEDPMCGYIPDENRREPVRPQWRADALERLKRIPFFIRPMIKEGIERYARMKGIREITPELLSELKKKFKR